MAQFDHFLIHAHKLTYYSSTAVPDYDYTLGGRTRLRTAYDLLRSIGIPTLYSCKAVLYDHGSRRVDYEQAWIIGYAKSACI